MKVKESLESGLPSTSHDGEEQRNETIASVASGEEAAETLDSVYNENL